nr:hypothetical protein B0A51_13174 [Rachicladosporium sp. CCFEE 5018]
MDSMRHLSTSLPGGRRRNDQTPQLLADFKAAALSVTNLYKAAAADNTRAREVGFQDALDELLAFLDRENLGLGDGEGWRVRQWATERLDDAQRVSDEDEDAPVREEATETRSSSPETQRKPALSTVTTDLAEESEPRRASEPPQQPHQPHTARMPPPAPSLETFNFRTSQQYPAPPHRESTNHDRETTMEVDPASTNTTPGSTPSTIRITPRSSRSRHSNHNRNRDGRNATSATLNFNLGTGAGSKRKLPYPDFFDISGLGNEGHVPERKDGNGRGGKRGRHV